MYILKNKAPFKRRSVACVPRSRPLQNLFFKDIFYSREREFTYVLEGSTANQPTRFRVLYRGPLSTHTVTDEDIVHLRVQSVNRKNVAVCD